MEPPSEPPPDDPLVVEPIDEDDDLIDRLIETNAKFRALLIRARAGPTVPFNPTGSD
jgi:hypothetical protein